MVCRMRKRKADSDIGDASPQLDENDVTDNSENNFKMENSVEPENEQQKVTPILEQEPNVGRIMKRVIPPEGKLSKEAKECMQECITEFLQFITSEASDKCASVPTSSKNEIHEVPSQNAQIDYVNNSTENNHVYVSQQNTSDVCLVRVGNEFPPTSSNNPTILNSSSPFIPQQQPGTLQQLPVFYDPNTRQHYLSVPGSDGTQTLHAINLTTAEGTNLSTNIIQAVQPTENTKYNHTHTGS